MRAKSLLLLIIALGCGTVASVGISQVMMDQKNQGPNELPTVEIFVTVKDVDVNQKLTAEQVKLEKWPQNRVPEGAIYKLEEVKDRFVRQRMYPGEPILKGKLNDSIVGVDTEIPRGYRVFDMSVNERNGGSGYIKPGARVDVLGTFKINNLTESRTVMRNMRVFGINGVTVRDADPTSSNRATTFQLLVKEEQMEALNLAAALGELRCTLRGTIENQAGQETTDTGEAFISWVHGMDKSKAAPLANLSGSAASDIFGIPAPAALAPATEEKKKELLIITPNGVTTYQWSRDDEMPLKVEPKAAEEKQATAATVAWPYASTGIPGVGGYAPTYPSSPELGQELAPGVPDPNANGSTPNQSTPPGGTKAQSGKTKQVPKLGI
jgi:pilus assembly protein CpaB